MEEPALGSPLLPPPIPPTESMILGRPEKKCLMCFNMQRVLAKVLPQLAFYCSSSLYYSMLLGSLIIIKN